MRWIVHEGWLGVCYSLFMQCFVSSCVVMGAESEMSAEDQMERLLSKCHLQCGYNRSVGCLVAVGSISRNFADPSDAARFLSFRNSMMQESELLARRNLIYSFAAQLKANEWSLLSKSNDYVRSQMVSAHEISAQEILHESVTFSCTESFISGVYQTVVVVIWGRRVDSLIALQKKIRCTQEKQSNECNEWTYFVKNIDLSSVVGTIRFIDRKGEFRFAGIGCYDVEGLDVASLGMKHAQDMALMLARGNLSLALNSDMQSNEVLVRGFIDGKEAEDKFKQRLQLWASNVTRHSDKRTAFAPEVYATFVTHPITKRKMFVSVCGYEPWQLVELGIVDRNMLQTSKVEQPPQMDSKVNPGVMIFNPNSGKFEKQ